MNGILTVRQGNTMTDQELREQTKRKGVYCKTIIHDAWLSTDFGLNFATRITGISEEQLEQLVGRNSKGKRKGLLKGIIRWEKVLIGGWRKLGHGEHNGYVVAPNTIVYIEIDDPYKDGQHPMYKLNEFDIQSRKQNKQ